MNLKMEFMQSTPLFAHMMDRDLTHLADDLHAREYHQGEIIFREGDAGQFLYLVASGQVRIFVNGVDGNETSVILFGRPGDMFGELAIVDGLPRSATAVALHNTLLYTLSREQFRHHMQQCPQLALNFMRELSMRVRYNTQQMDSMATLDISRRLARKLVELAQNYGQVTDDGVYINMPLTQTDLASLVGATRESINKILRDFRRHKWILLQQGQIIIRDPEALRAQVSL